MEAMASVSQAAADRAARGSSFGEQPRSKTRVGRAANGHEEPPLHVKSSNRLEAPESGQRDSGD